MRGILLRCQFVSPKALLSLSIHGVLVLGPLWIPKSEDAQVPSIK